MHKMSTLCAGNLEKRATFICVQLLSKIIAVHILNNFHYFDFMSK